MSKMLDELIQFNERFVAEKHYMKYATNKFPDKKMLIITCMDTRLLELLPRALNLRNGDAKFIKCAGAVVAHPYGSVMRSVLVAIYKLQVQEIFVIGHYDCGMTGMQVGNFIEDMLVGGVPQETIDELQQERDLSRWLKGFDDALTSVTESVEMLNSHPLMPANVFVHGLMVDPVTGKLDEVVNGYPS